MRPVSLFAPKVGPRTRIDVSGNVEGLLRRQSSRTVAGHQVMDERGGVSDPRHARADVVRSRSPQWRSSRRLRRSRTPIAVGPVTSRAGRREDLSSPRRITNERVELWNALSLHLFPWRVAAREKRDVRDHVAHVAAFRSQRLAVETSFEAIVDPILEQIDVTASRPVLRKARIGAHERHRIGDGAVGEMTVGAAQRGPGVLRQTVARIVNECATPAYRSERDGVLDLRFVGNAEGQGACCSDFWRRGRCAG